MSNMATAATLTGSLAEIATELQRRLDQLPEEYRERVEYVMNVSVPLIYPLRHGYIRALTPAGRGALIELDAYLGEFEAQAAAS